MLMEFISSLGCSIYIGNTERNGFPIYLYKQWDLAKGVQEKFSKTNFVFTLKIAYSYAFTSVYFVRE